MLCSVWRNKHTWYLLAFAYTFFELCAVTPMCHKIVIVVASYNNAAWCKYNLDSIFAQDYPHYHVLYIDDGSTDGTHDLVCEYIKEHGVEDKITVIHNQKRLGRPIENQYNAIHAYCAPTDIVVFLDGDDRFAPNDEIPPVDKGRGVLAYVNMLYQDEGVWITYGQYREWHSRHIGFCQPYPEQIIAHNEFRYYPHGPSHLRTCRAALFMNIKKEDLLDTDGQFLRMTGDLAAMLPMMEMAQKGHFRFVPVVLCEYNDGNPLSDHHVSKNNQRAADLLIRSRQRYQPLETLF